MVAVVLVVVSVFMIMVMIMMVVVSVTVVVIMIMMMTIVGRDLSRPTDRDVFRWLAAAAGVAHGRPPFRRRSP